MPGFPSFDRNLQVPDYSQILNLINQGNQQRQSPLATILGSATQGFGKAQQQSNINKLLQMYRQFYGQGSQAGGAGASAGGAANLSGLMPGFQSSPFQG